MKTLKLLIATLVVMFIGQTSFGQALTLDWYAPVLPNSVRINFNYGFGSDVVRLDFWKSSTSGGVNQAVAMPSINGITGSGALSYDVSDLSSNYSWLLLVNAVKNGQIIASLPIGGENGYAFNTMNPYLEVFDTWYSQGGAVVFRYRAKYGQGFPETVPVVKFYMNDLTTGQTDVLVDTITWWGAPTRQFLYVPEPAHFYEYCAEIFYSDGGALPLWSNELIASTCSEPVPYPYAMTTGLQEQPSNIEWLKVYPNPASDVITIEGLNKDLPIEIKDLTGRLVSKELMNTNSMNVSTLSQGMYILSQEDGRSIRFVKH